MYKKGGNQKKGAKFGTFLYFLYIKKKQIISPCWSDVRVTIAPLSRRTLEHLKRSEK